MWLGLFYGATKVMAFIASIAGYFHDRAQRIAGATSEHSRAQAQTIKAMQKVLAVPRTATRDDLNDKLKDGKL